VKLGAWIHNYGVDTAGVRDQFRAAARFGLAGVRGYSVEYSERVAPWLAEDGLSLVAGIHVDEHALVTDWRSQVKLDELERTVALGCRLEAICVGNELREGGDAWESKRFTARISYALARVVEEYRLWLDARGDSTRLTYAMEGIVFGPDGAFREHLWPLVDALDVVSINLYPMTEAHWRDFSAFDVSADFLRTSCAWRRAISKYEAHLRSTLDVVAPRGKPLFLSEMGFPSGVGYRIDGTIDGKDQVRPVSDTVAFGDRMAEYVDLLATASRDYDGLLEAAYFYEWWDNHRHSKIWNVEQSPIHTCFGLCDEEGTPKLDISDLVRRAR
jgi:hypothetical protein